MSTDFLDPLGRDPNDAACPQPAGLDEFGCHDPLRGAFEERRAGRDEEPSTAGAAVLVSIRVLFPDVREEAGEQRAMDRVGVGRHSVAVETQFV
jgi:hypothetical protein